MKNESDKCYYCGGLATTREHAPPKQMFKDFNCDTITVPSCHEHNCSKGGNDQAIVNVLLTSLKNLCESDRKYNIASNKDIQHAIKNASSSFERTKNRIINKPFLDDMPNNWKHLPNVGFLKRPIKIKDWIKNLTAAFIYDGINDYDDSIDWDKIDCWSPEYVDSEFASTSEDKLNLLFKYDNFTNWIEKKKWFNGWSAYPKKYPESIYCFFFLIEQDDFTIKHRFYNSFNWYATFKISPKFREKLLKKINA